MGVQLGEEEDKRGTLAIAPRWPWLGLGRADFSLERAGRGLLVWSSLGTPLRLGCGERTNQEEVKGKGKEGGIQFSSLSSLSLSLLPALSPLRPLVLCLLRRGVRSPLRLLLLQTSDANLCTLLKVQEYSRSSLNPGFSRNSDDSLLLLQPLLLFNPFSVSFPSGLRSVLCFPPPREIKTDFPQLRFLLKHFSDQGCNRPDPADRGPTPDRFGDSEETKPREGEEKFSSPFRSLDRPFSLVRSVQHPFLSLFFSWARPRSPAAYIDDNAPRAMKAATTATMLMVFCVLVGPCADGGGTSLRSIIGGIGEGTVEGVSAGWGRKEDSSPSPPPFSL